MSRIRGRAKAGVLLVFWLCVACGFDLRAQEPAAQPREPLPAVSMTSAEVVRQLTARDALVRKRAAEELAQMAAIEHRRLVEGYRAQEKDARVRVALDWALYRMGKREALYSVVGALDSARSDQAVIYLSHLETPETLYAFLARTPGRTQAKLLQVLGYIGDAATLEHIKPFTASLDPLLVAAANEATREISERLAAPGAGEAKPSRPRQTGSESESPADTTSP